MAIYILTAFEPNGEKIVEERIEASSDQEAKARGEQFLSENQLQDKTHRLVSPEGKLLLFHV